MKVILASKSQRRKNLLKKINLDFKVVDSKYRESKILIDHLNPQNYCQRLAYEKANKVSEDFSNNLIIGADTIIYLNKKIIGKPKNKEQAINHLRSLSNTSHIVYTGISLIYKQYNILENLVDETKVTFNKLNNKDINYYIDNYKPFDKAGSYGIQDWSSIFVKKIDGCFYNVVGFPLPKFYILFNKIINKIN